MRICRVRVEEERFVMVPFQPRENDFVQSGGIGGPIGCFGTFAQHNRILQHVIEAAIQPGSPANERIGNNARRDIAILHATVRRGWLRCSESCPRR